jgi:Reverse transcriptase (RNA-dependent DNA polymerase)
MLMSTTFLINKVGSGLNTLPNEKRSSLKWSIRLNADPTTWHLATSMDLKSQGHVNRSSNTLWEDAATLELTKIEDFDTFIDKGRHLKVKSPVGYKKIRVHLIFDVKHDGRHKARLVADGHPTDIPLESVYSGVVSLRGFRIVLFLAELNQLELWTTDIGNAHLEAFTSEKVYIIAGLEFGERKGYILIISKALYGIRSSSNGMIDLQIVLEI